MNKRISIIILLVVLFVIVYLMFPKRENKDQFPVQRPKISNIENKIVVVGTILSRKEVDIKSRVSGVISELFVKEGETVIANQKLAKINIITNPINLNTALDELQIAEINYNDAKKELDRNKKLFEQKIISEKEYNSYLIDYKLKNEKLKYLQANMELIKSRSVNKSSKLANIVFSSIDGIVVEIPVKVGSSVIESNTFNEGTTVAIVSDMHDLIFEGNVDEADIGHVFKNMEMSISIGAIEGKTFRSVIDYVALKGSLQDGNIKFKIRGRIINDKDNLIRVGYSATADILLQKKDSVLTIDENLLQFDNNKPFVDIETSANVFEKRYIKTGISNGIVIEVIDGLNMNDKIKIP